MRTLIASRLLAAVDRTSRWKQPGRRNNLGDCYAVGSTPVHSIVFLRTVGFECTNRVLPGSPDLIIKSVLATALITHEIKGV